VSGVAPRALCPRCGRPSVVCFCACITVLPTRTRLILLQHARERRVGIGTARMAHLALPGSVLRVGVDFAGDPVLQAVLSQPGPRYLLFPGPDARPVEDLPRDRPVTLVVLDGTWSQARKLLRLNPALLALPRVAFRPRRPSGYLIRRQPADFCVSTIEALAEVLAVLEPDGARFERLLDPFAAMVERQRWFESQVRAHRHRHRPGSGASTALGRVRDRLTADWPGLLCVQGEANGWPRHHPAWQPAENVHWLAHRPATGETFEAVVAPRRPLSPATADHVELPAERLLSGATLELWRRSWESFTRPGDTLVVWGTFPRELAAAEGLMLPFSTLDLRPLCSQLRRRRLGKVEDGLAAFAASSSPLGLPGRAGRRLASLVGLLEGLAGPPGLIGQRS
jgi:DTW domain-containing protein YfiP